MSTKRHRLALSFRLAGLLRLCVARFGGVTSSAASQMQKNIDPHHDSVMLYGKRQMVICSGWRWFCGEPPQIKERMGNSTSFCTVKESGFYMNLVTTTSVIILNNWVLHFYVMKSWWNTTACTHIIKLSYWSAPPPKCICGADMKIPFNLDYLCCFLEVAVEIVEREDTIKEYEARISF